MRIPQLLILLVFSLLATTSSGRAQAPQTIGVSTGEAELQRCEERIASVQREIVSRYESALSELQLTFQKAADLEGALAVRAERQRATHDGSLTEKSLVTEPKALRAIQVQMLGKLQELTTQIVQETIPRLIEHKKALTIAGKLDEAIAVRSAIEKLQNEHLPLVAPAPSVVVPVETLLQAYAADRSRADRIYKGNRLAVRGVIGGFRTDPTDSRQYQIFIGDAGGGWIQCAFSNSDFRFREEKQFNNTSLLLIPKENEAGVARIQKGQTVDIRGTCDGWDDIIRLSRCELVR